MTRFGGQRTATNATNKGKVAQGTGVPAFGERKQMDEKKHLIFAQTKRLILPTRKPRTKNA